VKQMFIGGNHFFHQDNLETDADVRH